MFIRRKLPLKGKLRDVAVRAPAILPRNAVRGARQWILIVCPLFCILQNLMLHRPDEYQLTVKFLLLFPVLFNGAASVSMDMVLLFLMMMMDGFICGFLWRLLRYRRYAGNPWQSGAKINISDGSCPERIVTVSGTTKAIYKAFLRITKKFEEWCSQFSDSPGGKTQIPIRLIVPASQCGSLIGNWIFFFSPPPRLSFVGVSDSGGIQCCTTGVDNRSRSGSQAALWPYCWLVIYYPVVVANPVCCWDSDDHPWP